MESDRNRWQQLASSFALTKPGLDPWDAELLDAQCAGAGHGEQCVIRFLLNLWNAECEWTCGRFDLFDALATWDETGRRAFQAWVNDPWWP